MKKIKCSVWCGVVAVGVAALVAVGGLGGCASLDRAYKQEVTWTNFAVVQMVTNTVVVTNTVPQVVERTNIVLVTNPLSGEVLTYETQEPVATNMVVTGVVTNFVPVFKTNMVQVPVTNLAARPEALGTIEAAGSVMNTFMPGIGSVLALALGGLYHGYRQLRNKRVNEALIQGVETARAVLTTTPQGQVVDAQFVKWLMDHQRTAGVFTTVSSLVEQLSDNPAARMTAQEIIQRTQLATERTASLVPALA